MPKKKLAAHQVVTWAKIKMKDFRVHLRPMAHPDRTLRLEWIPFTGKFAVVDRGQEEEFEDLEVAAEAYVAKFNDPKLRNKKQSRAGQKREKKKGPVKGIEEKRKLFATEATSKPQEKSQLSGSLAPEKT
jgi:hypothetical protein